MVLNLSVPELKELKPKITVFGVGGAGGNAINNMIEAGLSGVEFVAANTDAQALSKSLSDSKMQLGVQVTKVLARDHILILESLQLMKLSMKSWNV